MTLNRLIMRLYRTVDSSTLPSETKWLKQVIRLIHSSRFVNRSAVFYPERSSISSIANSNSETRQKIIQSIKFKPSNASDAFKWRSSFDLCNVQYSRLVLFYLNNRYFSNQVVQHKLLKTGNRTNQKSTDSTNENINSNENLDFKKSNQSTEEYRKRSKSLVSRKHLILKKNRMKDLNRYDDAIATLNTLQSNRLAIQARIINPDTLAAKLEKTKKQLTFLGVDQSDLESMNIVHISGTKGKGSTCAFIESILRKKGFKTGLFTSPHLISVRERIQLEGQPIDKALFSKNFFQVYNQLKSFDVDSSVEQLPKSEGLDNSSMPFYFNFLTLMALYTFKQQGCNATIIEVGIGGEYDCTNIIDRPVVTGITSLGIDHVKLLGNTIEEIAWHKSGIFKPLVPAFTSYGQRNEALEIMLNRAHERNCTLHICPPLEDFQTESNRPIQLGIRGQVQKMNGSLAIQICNYFLDKMASQKKKGILQTENPDLINVIDRRNGQQFSLDNEYLDAIEECKWRGRYEIIKLKNKSTFYLDGAHTVESLTYCIDWFRNECSAINQQINSTNKLYKILIFNCTGYRDYGQLLSPLLMSSFKFDMICFTTNLLKVTDLTDTKSDLFNAAGDSSNRDEFKSRVLKNLQFTGSVKHFDCLENCLKSIHIKNEENLANSLQTKVLVTGSIHLVGGVISLLNEFYC